jgi:hypothetical protein
VRRERWWDDFVSCVAMRLAKFMIEIELCWASWKACEGFWRIFMWRFSVFQCCILGLGSTLLSSAFGCSG